MQPKKLDIVVDKFCLFTGKYSGAVMRKKLFNKLLSKVKNTTKTSSSEYKISL